MFNSCNSRKKVLTLNEVFDNIDYFTDMTKVQKSQNLLSLFAQSMKRKKVN